MVHHGTWCILMVWIHGYWLADGRSMMVNWWSMDGSCLVDGGLTMVYDGWCLVDSLINVEPRTKEQWWLIHGWQSDTIDGWFMFVEAALMIGQLTVENSYGQWVLFWRFIMMVQDDVCWLLVNNQPLMSIIMNWELLLFPSFAILLTVG